MRRAPCVRVTRERGETVRRALKERGVLDESLAVASDGESLYLPVTDSGSVEGDYDVVTRQCEERDGQRTPSDILGLEPTYERLGDIVILQEDDDERARRIARAVMASDLPVKTVVNQASDIQGEKRLREWSVIAGNGTDTVHREYGFEYALDLASVYFSPRLATERHRVTQQGEAGERVFDMFAGVGPYAIPFAARGARVVAVDINEAAVEFLKENAERNQVADRVTAVCGDVREAAVDHQGWADRVVMNLPHSAHEFLDVAVGLASGSCVVHYYDMQPESDAFGPGLERIRAVAEPGYEVAVLDEHVVRSYAPGVVNVCLDVELRG